MEHVIESIQLHFKYDKWDLNLNLLAAIYKVDNKKLATRLKKLGYRLIVTPNQIKIRNCLKNRQSVRKVRHAKSNTRV